MPLALPQIRTDLIYSPDHNSPGYTFVKCPVRRDFFRFNDVQISLMKAMDGRTTVEELIAKIGEEWGVEMTEDQISRFMERLSERFLLDITSYQIDDKKTSAQIKKLLTKAGFHYRVEARDASNPEANLFAQGMRHATGDNPLQAASYFQAILEINPHNRRARQVLDCIHQAFLNMRRKEMAHGAKSLPLVNPNEFLGVVDKHFGSFVFSWLGAIVIFVFCLAEIPMFIDLLSSPEFAMGSFSGYEILSFSVAVMFIALMHELGHALASKHYGGTPSELGLQLILGIVPGAYCDASDTYLFKEPRHKIICFLSGLPAQLIATTMCCAFLLVIPPTTPGWYGGVIACLFSIGTTYQNLNPLIPFDGYYALGDYLRILNLRDRSFEYVWHALARRIFGVTTLQYEETPDHERRALLTFGLLAMLYTLFYVVVIMLNWLVPLAVEHLGMVGLLLVCAYLYGQTMLITRTLLIPFVRFLVANRSEIFGVKRSVVYALGLGGIVWVLSISGHVWVDGQMRTEPIETAYIVVREAGVVDEVFVEEGQNVQAGQALFQLHSEDLERDLAQAEQAVAMAALQLKMLEAGTRPERVALVLASHRANRARSRLMTNKLRRARSLEALEVGTAANVLASKSDAVQASGVSRVSSAALDVAAAGNSKEDIAQAKAQLKKEEGKLAALRERKEALTIRARTRGRIATSELHMFKGRWMAEGEALVSIENTEEWRVRIRPGVAEPITGLAEGDEVALRAYGFPHEEIKVRVSKLLPPADDKTESIIIETTGTKHERWISGLSGRARVYGPKRSLAYRFVALPLIQVFNVRVAPMFKDV